MDKTNGFTLIELLVVITIIVVLLAMLAPALDKAVYQAQLAVCGANLKAVAAGANLYAMNNRRSYPTRSGSPFAACLANDDYENLRQGIVDQPNYDLRPVIKPYIGLASLIDPMVAKIGIDKSDSGGHFVEVSYNLRFGLGFVGQTSMRKVGDRWTWTDALTYPSQPRVYSFTSIAEDQDRVTTTQSGAAISSHPDSAGVMSLSTDWTGNATNYVYSRWQVVTTNNRGPVDMNSAYADGSVLRSNKFPINSRVDGPTLDERMARVPFYVKNSNWDVEWINLPVP